MEDTPFYWIENQNELNDGLKQLVAELNQCPLLAVDLEYCDVKLDDDGTEVGGIVAII